MTGAASLLPERSRIYESPIADSGRWDGFANRPGDILVCTPPKCGTTWTQMICALIVHQSPQLPASLTRLSRWIERHTEPIEAVNAELGAQAHRRVLKTHTPLDGLPYLPDAAYVVCGRDPRDAFLSMIDNLHNVSDETLAAAARRAGFEVGAGLPFPTEPDALFPIWMTTPQAPWVEDGFIWGSVLYHLRSFWPYRGLPNVHFMHYADLMADLDGEMRRLSAFLGVPVNEALWPSLVGAASFSSMKGGADEAAPGAHLGEWRDNTEFFKRARMGEWRRVLSPENQALYEKLSAERLEPALKAWLEGGRGAFDPQPPSP